MVLRKQGPRSAALHACETRKGGLPSIIKALSGAALLRLFRRGEGQSLVHDRAGRSDSDRGTLFPAAAAALSTRTNPLAALGREHLSSSGRRTIELEPDKWTGGAIPILSYIEPAEARERLSEGRWTVLFFQHDCRECQHEIQTVAGRGGRDVVCVEIPPYGEESCVPDNLIHVKLTDRYDWYVETPKLLPAARLK